MPTTLYDVVYKMPTRPSLLAAELGGDVDRVLAIGTDDVTRGEAGAIAALTVAARLR